MFASILNILKKSDGYVHFSDICKTLERNQPDNDPTSNQNQWYETVHESLGLAHSQGLIFKSDDNRYKFALKLGTSEDPKLLTRIDALKMERQAESQVGPAMEPALAVEEIAGPSGYAYRIVPQELQQGDLRVENRKSRSKERSTVPNRSKKRSRSRSAKGARNSKK